VPAAREILRCVQGDRIYREPIDRLRTGAEAADGARDAALGVDERAAAVRALSGVRNDDGADADATGHHRPPGCS